MATIQPFRGIRYNPATVPDLSMAVTQPYDRISQDLRDRYLQQHPHSFVQLILSDVDPHQVRDDPIAPPCEDRGRPKTGDYRNPYRQVAAVYRRWRRDGVLDRDEAPSLYAYQQTFSLPDGSTLRRKALIAALQLTQLDEGTVLPHERTLSAPKADRLYLMRATHANLEPVFLLYPDPTNRINDMLDLAIAGRAPMIDVHEAVESAVRHQLWAVTGADVIKQVVAAMAPKRRLIIADGHHRYETALNFRDEMRVAGPDTPAGPPHDFVLAAMVSMDDPGLRILPTHRLVHSYHRMTPTELEAAAGAHFVIRQLSDREQLGAALRDCGEKDPAVGFVTRDRQSIWTLKNTSVMDELAPGRALAWRQLDVAVLHQLVLENLMGLTPDSVARQENLHYLREAQVGFRALDTAEAQFMFLLNPTRIAQVRACAESGERMPQKSTDFYPKMISGLVLREI